MPIKKNVKTLSPKQIEEYGTTAGFAEAFLGFKLYPKQREALNYFNKTGSQTSFASCNGGGKALALDTPVLTTGGWSTMGELKIGDYIFGSDGRPYPVSFVTEVMHGRPCNRVIFSDRSEVIADDEHLWKTVQTTPIWHSNSKHRCSFKKDDKVITTLEIASSLRYGTSTWGSFAHAIPVCNPLQFEEKQLPIAPYTLGAWLGDGDSANNTLTFSESDSGVLDEIRKDGYELGKWMRDPRNNSIRCIIGISTAKRTWQNKTSNGLRRILRDNNMFLNKHIPKEYLTASIPQREALLQGLMDTDGYCDPRGKCEFTSVNKRLAEGVFELVNGLGIKATINEGVATIKGRVIGPKYRVVFKPNSLRKIFRLERKQKNIRRLDTLRHNTTENRKIYSISKISSVPVRCITVESPDHCYLIGRNFIITHNTARVLVAAVLWHLFMYPKGKIACTSGKFQQIEEQIMPALWEHKKKFNSWKWYDTPFIQTEESGFFSAFSTIKPGYAEGYHAGGEEEPLLFIVDEAKSAAPWLEGVVEGRIHPTRLLLLSSHGFAEGWFYDSHTRRKGDYKCVVQRAEDCPHIEQKHIEDVRRKWGRTGLADSILGHGFMALIENAVIDYKEVDRAVNNPPKHLPGEVHAFCDFAWSSDGDESVLALRSGNRVTLEACFRAEGLHAVCDRFILEFLRLRFTKETAWQISGDEGGGGQLIMDEMDRRGWRLQRWNNGSAAKDPEHFQDSKAECWYNFSELLNMSNLILPNDDDMRVQLVSRKRIAGSKGRLAIEPKVDMKERGISSPDRADAVIGCCMPNSGGWSTGAIDTVIPMAVGNYQAIGA